LAENRIEREFPPPDVNSVGDDETRKNTTLTEYLEKDVDEAALADYGVGEALLTKHAEVRRFNELKFIVTLDTI
jgi:hypothetical protein